MAPLIHRLFCRSRLLTPVSLHSTGQGLESLILAPKKSLALHSPRSPSVGVVPTHDVGASVASMMSSILVVPESTAERSVAVTLAK